MSSKPEKRPMTPDELIALGMLRGVKFASPSWDERTAKCLFKAATPPICTCPSAEAVHASDCPAVNQWQPTITKKMSFQLWRVLFHHRRQIKHPKRVKYLRMAENLMVPDYRTYEYRKKQEAGYKLAKVNREAAEKEAA